MKRSAALTLSVLIAAALSFSATPVLGAKTVDTDVTAPKDGAVVIGEVLVEARASSSTGIKRIELSIDGTRVTRKDPSGVVSSVGTDYDWDSAHDVGSTQLSSNGVHKIKVWASNHEGSTSSSTIKVLVDNAPAPVAGLTLDEQADSAVLGWAANLEPDIMAYEIRRDSGEGPVPVARVETTTYSELPGPGRHAYTVVALRNSPTLTEGRPSISSEQVVASFAAPSAGGQAGGAIKGKAARGSTKRGFVVSGGTRIGVGGLPSGVNLAGAVGLPELPASPIEWGTYKKRLPYDFPARGQDTTGVIELASSTTGTFVPADGLRWIAGGLWLAVLAGLLLVLSRRLVDEFSA